MNRIAAPRSLDSAVATRLVSEFASLVRGLKPTAKFMTSLRDGYAAAFGRVRTEIGKLFRPTLPHLGERAESEAQARQRESERADREAEDRQAAEAEVARLRAELARLRPSAQ